MLRNASPGRGAMNLRRPRRGTREPPAAGGPPDLPRPGW